MATKSVLAPHVVREISVAASVDPKTVVRVLAGHNTRPMPRARIVKALNAAGLGHLAPAEELPGGR